jgi:hypothetical protein
MLEAEVFLFSKNSNFEEIFEYPFKYLCDNKYLEPKHPF